MHSTTIHAALADQTASNVRSCLPEGVSGAEYEIAGPDFEDETDEPCPKCSATTTVEVFFRGQSWLACGSCDHLWGEGSDDDDLEWYDRLRDDEC